MSAGKIQRNPATGKVKRNPRNGKLVRSSATDTTCCCADGGGGTDIYPLLYCPGGTVETGQAIAITPAEAVRYVGKVLRVLDPDGFGWICAIVGGLPVPPLNPADYTFPTFGDPIVDCGTCCNCEGVTQPTSVVATATIPCVSGGVIVSDTLTANAAFVNGCKDGYDGSTIPPMIDCEVTPGLDTQVSFILQYTWNPIGEVPAGWDCWWTLVVTVAGSTGYDVVLYKRGGQTALGTYKTITPSPFNTATVS